MHPYMIIRSSHGRHMSLKNLWVSPRGAWGQGAILVICHQQDWLKAFSGDCFAQEFIEAGGSYLKKVDLINWKTRIGEELQYKAGTKEADKVIFISASTTSSISPIQSLCTV